MYDPNQVPRQVRMSVYLKGTNDEVRNSYGIPIQFNELFTSFTMSGVMRPGLQTLLNPRKGENVVLNNEFQMRSNCTIGFKRKSGK